MLTMENYLLEEGISDASVDDIALEQAIAEFEVSTAILECALKCEMILENTSTDLDDFDIFQEGLKETWDKIKKAAKDAKENLKNTANKFGKDTGDAGKKIGKATGNGAKNAAEDIGDGFVDAAHDIKDAAKDIGSTAKEYGKNTADTAKMTGNWIKDLWNTIITAIANFFANLGKVDFKKLAHKVEDDYSDDHIFTVKYDGMDFNAWINEMDDLTHEVLALRQNDPMNVKSIEKLRDRYSKFASNRTETDKNYNTSVEYKKSEFVNLLNDLNDKARSSYNSYGQLKKALNLKNLDKSDYNLRKEVVTAYKELVKFITKAWRTAAKNAKKVITAAMDNAKKADYSPAVVEKVDSEIVNSESYVDDDIDAMTFQENALNDKYNSKEFPHNHPSLEKVNFDIVENSDDDPKLGIAAKWKRVSTRSMAALRSGKSFTKNDIEAFMCNLMGLLDSMSENLNKSHDPTAIKLSEKCDNFNGEIDASATKYVYGTNHKNDQIYKIMKSYIQRADKLVKEYMALKTKVKLESYFEDTDALIYEEQLTETGFDDEYDPVFEAEFADVLDYIFQEYDNVDDDIFNNQSFMESVDKETRKSNRDIIKVLKMQARNLRKIDRDMKKYGDPDHAPLDITIKCLKPETTKVIDDSFAELYHNQALPKNKYKEAFDRKYASFHKFVEGVTSNMNKLSVYRSGEASASNAKEQAVEYYKSYVRQARELFKLAVKYTKSIKRDVNLLRELGEGDDYLPVKGAASTDVSIL